MKYSSPDPAAERSKLLTFAHSFSHVTRTGIFHKELLIMLGFEPNNLKGDGEMYTVYIHLRVTGTSN